MRIREMFLRSYGRFQGKTIELPKSKVDFHVIFGPNEAGKSTIKQAITDACFGVKNGDRTTAAYRVKSKNVRIGFTLERDGTEFSFIRKTGNRETVLDTNEKSIVGGEKRLQDFLHGMQKDHFDRTFSIDYETLTAGGHEMLNTDSDLGKILFSATASVFGLKDILSELAGNSSNLWRARAKNLPLNMNLSALLELQRNLKTQSLSTDEWFEAMANVETASSARDSLQERKHAVDSKLRNREMISRVMRSINKRNQAQIELEQLGPIPDVGPEVEVLVDKLGKARVELVKQDANADHRSTNLRNLETELTKTVVDQSLLQLDETIKGLISFQGAADKAKIDLPSRDRDIASCESILLEHAKSIGWGNFPIEKVKEMIPPQSVLDEGEALRSEGSNLRVKVEAFKRELDRARKRQDSNVSELSQLEAKKIDTVPLQRSLAKAGQIQDLRQARLNCLSRQSDLKNKIELWFEQLKPFCDDLERLEDVVEPTAEEIDGIENRLNALSTQEQRLSQEIESSSQDIAGWDAEIAKIDIVDIGGTTDQLGKARNERDQLWQEVKSSIEERDVDELLLARYEESVDRVDSLAEQLVLLSRIEAEKNRVEGERAKRAVELENSKARLRKIEIEQEQVISNWHSCWMGLNRPPESPAAMRNWLQVKSELVRFKIEVRHLQQEINENEEALEDLRNELLSGMDQVGRMSTELQTQSIYAILETVISLEQEQKSLENDISTHADIANTGKIDLEVAVENYENAALALTGWQERWQAFLDKVELRDGSAIPAAQLLTTIGRLINTLERMRNIEKRREDMRSDIAQFEQGLDALIVRIGRSVDSNDRNQLLLMLNEELAAERIKLDHRKEIKAELKKEKESQDLELIEKKRAEAIIQELQAIFKLDDDEKLDEAINKWRKAADLSADISRLEHEIVEDGSGFSISELEKQCAETTMEEIAQTISDLEKESRQLNDELQDKIEDALKLEHELKALRDGEETYKLEAEMESTLAQVEAEAVRFLHSKVQEVALEFALGRLREAKQGPLLSTAEEYFCDITNGMYSQLTTSEDNKGIPQLFCVRQDGEDDVAEVAIDNLSSGTREQLFLALRFAAIEHFLDQGQHMFFIADDLVINSDDARAKMVLECLKKLATKTQVLFFTHHMHLKEIAESVFGEELSFVSLVGEG